MEPPEHTNSDDIIRQRLIELKGQRETLMKLEPEEIQDAILSAHEPAALVHSFHEEDFYFLIHTIGPEDALPVLKLASAKQWEYIIDQEAWQKDLIHMPRMTHWLYLLLKADPLRLARWCMQEKSKTFELYLFHNIEIRIREHDEDPSIFGPGFMTDDDVYYFRLIDFPATDADMVWTKEQRNELVPELLSRISAKDHIHFQSLLHRIATLIPSESEEERYRLRNVRLSEKGFLPFDEAVGVYQALAPEKIGCKGNKILPCASGSLNTALVPLFTSNSLDTDNLFTRTLFNIHDNPLLMFLQTEFASLCNQIIAADQKVVQSRKDLSSVVNKASGYLSIGLDVLTQFSQSKPTIEATALLRKYLLSEIFRVGYGKALALKWKAERWRKESWFSATGLPLAFWGEAWLGVLGGLLVKKPLFFDNYQTSELYREFGTLADIQNTQAVLEEITTFDLILSMMEINLPDIDIKRRLSYKNLLLTLWADHHTGIQPNAKVPVPIPLNAFKNFFKELWDPDTTGKISETIKTIFLDWLSNQSELTVIKLSQMIGNTLTSLFEELEMEMGYVSFQNLDPRFIHLFLVN
jgi:hypothetical protein